jgi:DNA-binding protein H-NS
MAKVALDKLSMKDLKELLDDVKQAIVDRAETDKAEARRKIEVMAAEAGYSLMEIVKGGRSSGRRAASGAKGSKVAVKYRNPKDASETWTGRGRQPRWLAAKIKQGAKLESFLI